MAPVGSSSLGKEEDILPLNQEEERQDRWRYTETLIQREEEATLIRWSQLLIKESSRKYNENATGHCLDNPWGKCHFPLLAAWQTPINPSGPGLPPPASSVPRQCWKLCHLYLSTCSSLTALVMSHCDLSPSLSPSRLKSLLGETTLCLCYCL